MKKRTIIRICAIISGLSGLVILIGAILPIAIYESQAKQKYPMLISPVVADNAQNNVSLEDYDLTRASNWFVDDKVGKKDFNQNKIKYYSLTVPKLNIENANVRLGGEDLSESLIQYPGTAMPGQIGNSVIFGHSILPIFYDPKNYMAIFSTLPSMDVGDEIYINYDGVKYTYRVIDMFEVKPTDMWVLDQDTDGSYISLVTCTPPGHPDKPKRLIVKAKIVLPELSNANIK